MADAMISQLPVATTTTSADILPIVQGGITKQVSLSNLTPAIIASTGKLGVNNYSSAFMKRWQQYLAAIRNNSSSGRVACIGDSHTMGYDSATTGYTNARLYSYPTGLSSVLNDFGLNTQSDNFFGNANVSGTYNDYDPRLVLGTGVVNNNGTSLGGFFFVLPSGSSALAFTPGTTFNRVTIYYYAYSGGGSFTVDVGGSAIGSPTSTNATAQVKAVTITVPDSSTIVNFTQSSGASVFIVGASCWTSSVSQVHILNMGWSGSTSADWARTAFPADPANAIAAVAPEFAFINLGCNDYINGTSTTLLTSNLVTLIGKLKPNTSVCLIVPTPSAISIKPLAFQQTYRDAILAAGVATNTPVIDLMARRESYEIASAFGLYSDTIHGSTFGNLDVSNLAADIILHP